MEKDQPIETAKKAGFKKNASIVAVALGRLLARFLKWLWKFSRRNWRALSIVASGLLLVFFAYGYIHTKNQLEAASKPKTEGLIKDVGKLVELPANETPTTATVNDASKLKNQQFFADAQNGDRVLIYQRAGKAVLYRPSTHKVIQYTYINLNGQ